jgi:antitoxin component of MazEF toxin-antitoxin module
MKVPLRRIGNSLGVILPKATLEAWGVGEGDTLELSERGLRPPAHGALSHQQRDQLKLLYAHAVVRQRTPREIRAKALANLHRWKRHGVWVSAHDEWRQIVQSDDDGLLFAAMLGRDDNAVRLRQSAPYIGLLTPEELKKLHEEARA